MSTKKSSFNTGRACAWLLGLSALLMAGCGGGSDSTPAGGTSGPVAPAPETPGGGGAGPDAPTPEIPATVRVGVLSTKAWMVAGTDALLEVEVLDSTIAAAPVITSNGVDVTADFAPDATTGKLIGKITNVNPGANEVRVKLGDYIARLAITGNPVEGPIISGPHQKPFICNTSFVMPTGVPALTLNPDDPNCGVVTQVDYVYRTTGNAFIQLPNATTITSYPANLKTTTVAGITVPYVIRLETGTINRAIYQTAILHDVINEPMPSPTQRSAGWNGKVIYPLGGGCQGGWFRQGAETGADVVNDGWLAKGYAVTSSTLNVMGQNCNDLLSSETIVMVKERFIKNYGVPLFTIGTGGSGGSYQSNQTSDNYPGIFDGIIISSVFADVNSSTLFKLFDSRLLNTYFTANGGGYTEAQKLAISGYRQVGNISNMSGQAGRVDPTVTFPAGVVAGVGPTFRYNATTNRGGARASVYDATRNVYGVTSEGHALRPIDNVGVQYGLQALKDNVITFAQFLDLNQKIGGLDRDLKAQAGRSIGDPGAIERAYQSGRIVWGGGGLASTAIIDNRNYLDEVVGGDIHTKIHSFSVRERLRKANGHFNNHVILTVPSGVDTMAQMDAWLSAVKADTSSASLADKVVANRPADLKDACWKGGVKYEEEQTAFGAGTCNSPGFYPAGTTPRMVAGGPLADDIVKCQLKPLNPADYPASVAPAQLLLLQNVFPQGVCDWSKPGVSQQPSRAWTSFGPSPVNLLFDITKP